MMQKNYSVPQPPELSSLKDIATVHLSSELQILALQPNTSRLSKEESNLLHSPLKEIFKFLNFIQYRELEAQIRKQLSQQSSFRLDVKDRIGRKFLLDIFQLPSVASSSVQTCLRIIQTHHFFNALNKSFIAKESFEIFYENDPVMHVSIDPKTKKVLDCNHFTVDSLKYNSKKDIVGHNVFKIFHPSAEQKVKELIAKFECHGQLRNEIVLLRRNDGITIDAKLNTNAVYDEKGQILRSQSTLTDITELKKTEEVLAFQKEKLEHANVELEQFAAICSHDLKEPLNTIKISSEILALKYRELIDEKGKSYFDYIGEATMRMANQINALMKHARLGIQSKALHTNLNSVLQQVLLDLRPKIREANASIITDVLPTIAVYPTELRLLFQNLISNSLKYSKETSAPKIKIKVTKEDHFFIFSFSDNGQGISAENYARIFNLFERADADGTRQGSGVGLAHCKKIAKLHGGDIWVTSKINEGSTFYVKILSNIDYLKADLSA